MPGNMGEPYSDTGGSIRNARHQDTTHIPQVVTPGRDGA